MPAKKVAVKQKVCYDGSMNKDVVYIEPEEDITDIISKIEGSKSKIVALVPPKKAGVFRSIVNIKLITKSADSAGKTVVLVTTDPSIIKLAAATKMPVTKDLKTAPEIPSADDEIDDTETVDVDEDGEEEKTDKSEASEEEETENGGEIDSETSDEDDEKAEESAKESEKDVKNASLEAEEADSDDEEKKAPKDRSKSEKPAKKASNRLANSNNPVLKWIGTHKKADIAICSGLLVLIIVAVWAFAIAPAVTITLKLETTTGNFSENVTFTQTLADEKVSEGKFYIEEKKQESKTEVEFEATGSKNVGDKASGKIKVTHYFPLSEEGGKISIGNGTTFTNSGLTFTVTSGATISWDGDLSATTKDCENQGTSGWRNRGCAVSATVTVTANDSGTKYNISSASSGWSTSIQLGSYDTISSDAMTGGTDKTVPVVQQSDIDKAVSSINSESSSDNKQKLLDSLGDDAFAIESSFKQETSDPVSTPKVGEEVEDGKKAKLTVTTTSTIFVMDETKLKEFIEEKAKLADGYKIYTMNDPFIENFTNTDSGYIGKLKTSYIAGSTITENEVVETVKGKGIGSAKRDLSDNFNGIKSITFDTSVPWVTSVPGDTNKITVKIDVEE